ncbi:beta-D-glucosyl crocetin beta-1,6-glucosyltransferase-like [Solanum pennellii]|uniref:Beta-D-glucosyl crocetin beta-1,6-glucosyltransferase-like n=1 Tax=Solanum pennellii TaxID=28526 RepID=A0ABM1FIN4_SOLPN|nr:beta-D-glucosyl crocetin beta-1,6-glucosyltransferase-like [Solanum pennellii]
MNFCFRKKNSMATQVPPKHRNALKVLMFPWLAYGHISPFLDLAMKLADRGFSVRVCSTIISRDTINKQIPEKYSASIKMVELCLPKLSKSITNEIPVDIDHTVLKTLKSSKSNFAKILQKLKPDLVIYDLLLQWAEGVAKKQGIPAMKFVVMGAAAFSYFYTTIRKPEVEFPFQDIYPGQNELMKLNELIAESSRKEKYDDAFAEGNIQVMLMSTSRTIEGKYIDYFTKLSNWKVIPVGLPIKNRVTNDVEVIDWLGTKDEGSTIFVSFGNEYVLSKEEMEELAFGLELSNVNFVWVVRFPERETRNLEDVLPKGFFERIGERGRVLDKCVLQSRISNHSSIGGFVSPCGWHNVIECLDFGVPIIAMPIHLDQPMNAKLMVELGVAMEIVRDDDGKIHREEIAETLKGVVTRGNLRAKVRDVSKNLKTIGNEEMDTAAKELIQLCKK